MAEPYVQLALEESPIHETADRSGTPYRVSTDVVYPPVTSFAASASPQHLSRADEARGILGEPRRLVNSYEPSASAAFRGYIDLMTWFLECAGFQGAHTAGNGTNEVVTLTPDASTMTGGTWTITFDSETTGALPYSATAAQVKAALEELSTIGVGNIKVTGGPLTSGAFTLTFIGDLAATNVGAVTVDDSSLTGPDSPYTVTEAVDTAGVDGTTLLPDGTKVPSGAHRWVFTKRGGPSAQTMQAIIGRPHEGVFERISGLGVTGLTLNAMGEMSAEMIGIVYKNIADPSLTPAPPASFIPPVLTGDLTLTQGLASTAASVDYSFSLQNPLERFRDLSLPSKFFHSTRPTGEPAITTASVSKDILADADIDALLAGEGFALTAAWRVPYQISTTGGLYRAYIETPHMQYVGGNMDALANRRRFGGSFDCFAAHDDVTGYDVKITLCNGVSAIDTGI